MSRSREVKFLIFIIITFLMVLVFACKEPTEGCLNIEAANYDVSADDPCPDCCEFPQLKLEVSNRFDTVAFNYSSVYDLEGNIGQFEKVIFYCSDFRLVSFNDSLETIDTIELDIIGREPEIFKDDFILVSPDRSFRYDLGEIRGGTGQFNVLKFNIGLAGNAEIANAEMVDSEHPLTLGVDSLWTFPEGYIFNQIIIVPDTTDQDFTRKFNIKGPSRLVEISIPFTVEVDLGFDVTIPITIDYNKWFSGIDFVTDSNEEIINTIVENTPNVISITE